MHNTIAQLTAGVPGGQPVRTETRGYYETNASELKDHRTTKLMHIHSYNKTNELH